VSFRVRALVVALCHTGRVVGEDTPGSLSRRSVLRGMAAAGVLAGLGVSLTGCDPVAYLPGAEATWATIDPAAAGWDPVKLEAALSYAGSHASQAFVILADGKILAERYWGGRGRTWQRDVASVQKSISSLLAVMAVDKGLLDDDAKVARYLGAGWTNLTAAQEAPITVRHLLTMTSGMTEQLTYLAPPGTKWWYNSNAYYCLNKVLSKVTGLAMTDLCTRWLMNPIGGEHDHWAARPGTGGFSIDPKGDPIEGFYCSALDLARIGLLVQRDGLWGSTRLLPSAGLTTAITPSQALNQSYGQLFWLNGQPSFVDASQHAHTGELFTTAPSDLVCALGLVDQKIYVSRSKKLVITRLGDDGTDPDGTKFDTPLWQLLTAAMPG